MGKKTIFFNAFAGCLFAILSVAAIYELSDKVTSALTADIKEPGAGEGQYYPASELEKNKLDEYWVNRIKEGGLILHFRHWQRDLSIHPANFDAWEINNGLDARQEWFGFSTCLLEKGIAEGKLVRKLFEHSKIKVAKVYSSPSCRAVETALYGFGKVDEKWRSLLHRTSIPPSRWPEHARDLRNRLLSIEIPEDENIVLTGHGGTLSIDADILFDETPKMKIDDRNQGGLLVIERTPDGLFARHVFNEIYQYTQSMMDYPVLAPINE